MYCSKCGKQQEPGAQFCGGCGTNNVTGNTNTVTMDSNNIVRFLLTFFLGFIGSFIINHTTLRPQGFKSRTMAYFFLGMITFGIYSFVASIFNFAFDSNKPTNVGYHRVEY